VFAQRATLFLVLTPGPISQWQALNTARNEAAGGLQVNVTVAGARASTARTGQRCPCDTPDLPGADVDRRQPQERPSGVAGYRPGRSGSGLPRLA
jgi:hypothetical protein